MALFNLSLLLEKRPADKGPVKSALASRVEKKCSPLIEIFATADQAIDFAIRFELKKINLSGYRITTMQMTKLAEGVPGLEALKLQSCNIGEQQGETPEILAQIAKLTNLNTLDLFNNQLNRYGEGVAAIKSQLIKLKQMSDLFLFNISFSPEQKQEIHDLFSRELPECILWL